MSDPHPFPAAVGAALAEHGVRGAALVACSGGGDSLALLRACVELRDAGADLRPVAGSFDHRQRDDSAADRHAVAAACEEWGCGFADGRFDGARGASEATLRAARYGWLSAAAADAGADHLLTGHTADDQAETVLLRVIRGTGLSGLAGIPPEGPVPGPAGGPAASRPVRVVRPMLGCTGAKARDFLRDRGVTWREDPTNATPDFTRNRLRHNVLPRLEELNPRVREAAVRLSAAARDEAAAAVALADAALEGQVVAAGAECIVLRAEALLALPEPARRAALRRVWRRSGWPERRMGREQWRRLAGVRPGSGASALPHGVTATLTADRLTLTRPAGGPGRS